MQPGSLFERKQNVAIYWYNKSSDLRGASAALWASMDESKAKKIAEEMGLGSGYSMRIALFPVWLMNSGLAMEDIYKAIIIEKGKSPPLIHKLADLAHQASVPITDKEKGLLHILSGSIEWAGRYPAPKNEQEMDKYHALVDKHLYDRVPFGKSFALRPNRALNWSSFNRMWGKASEAFWKIHS